jgi:hypothetical protein
VNGGVWYDGVSQTLEKTNASFPTVSGLYDDSAYGYAISIGFGAGNSGAHRTTEAGVRMKDIMIFQKTTFTSVSPPLATLT